MLIINLPSKLTATVVPIISEQAPDLTAIMHTFTLGHTNFSLEEAVAIKGFVGYVCVTAKGYKLFNTPINWNAKGQPLSLVAVVFTRD